MSTTTTPARVTIASVERRPQESAEKKLSTLGDFAFEAVRFPDVDRIFAERPSEFAEPMYEQAFDKQVVDAAIVEIYDDVIDLFLTALRKRLPWTWEGEELYR